MKTSPYSLRRRLLFAILGSSLLVWVVGLIMISVFSWRIHLHTIDETLRETGRLMISATADFHKSGSFPEQALPPLPAAADPRQQRRNHMQYQIVFDGTVISKSRNAPTTPFIQEAEDRAFFDIPRQHTTNRNISGRHTNWWRVFVVKNRDGRFEVHVAQLRPSLFRYFLASSKHVLMLALALLLLLSILGWWAIRRLLVPLEHTASLLAQKSPHDLTPIPRTGLSEELSSVVHSLNLLLDRLDRALHTERRFTADAAHELRTPLAALRVQAQLLERQHPQLAEPIEKLYRDIDRCTALLEQLLLLARLDPLNPNDVDALPREHLALAPWLENIRQQCLPASDVPQGATITVHGDADLKIDIHPEMMGTALRNLLDNALRYGARHVELRVERDVDTVRLLVADDGPGVTADHHAQLTQRFFRILGSGQSGSGLGLSIVQRIVELHQGKIEFGKGLNGGGLGVTLVLPQF
ncbi:MAG: two-component sensor histidine kinase [Burkholderiales bacterium]|jgi:two-component system sensor histidine kinase QseC|nr:two-component sensor histidine kinase [Burkholderiales bacterium]